MERIISKLTSLLVVTLLCAAAMTTANSQTRRKVTPIDKKSGATSEEALVTKKSAEQISNEIRCRGYSKTGGSEYVFFEKAVTTFEMAYTPSLKAAGPRGEGLRPGECSWVDRPIGNNGPYRIRFDIPANDQLTIPEYLKDENHYWSFFIQNTNQNSGYFEATSNRYWKPSVIRKDEILTPVNSRVKTRDRVLLPTKPE